LTWMKRSQLATTTKTLASIGGTWKAKGGGHNYVHRCSEAQTQRSVRAFGPRCADLPACGNYRINKHMHLYTYDAY